MHLQNQETRFIVVRQACRKSQSNIVYNIPKMFLVHFVIFLGNQLRSWQIGFLTIEQLL